MGNSSKPMMTNNFAQKTEKASRAYPWLANSSRDQRYSVTQQAMMTNQSASEKRSGATILVAEGLVNAQFLGDHEAVTDRQESRCCDRPAVAVI